MNLFKINTLKAILTYSLLVFLVSCQKETNYKDVEKFSNLEKYYKNELLQTAITLDSINTTTALQKQKQLFDNARKHFKSLEPLLALLDYDSYTYLNQPNILKIEEEDFTDIKIKNPVGFQVIEEMLYTPNCDAKELKNQVEETSNRLRFLHQNHSLQYLENHHILWIMRDEINRIALMGITGFDSPVAKKSLPEALAAYTSLQTILGFFEEEFSNKELYTKWIDELEKSKRYLSKTNFDTFDRYHFIKNHTQESLKIWIATVADWQVEFPFKQAINYEATSLFAKNTFNVNHFTDQQNPVAANKVALGKSLFEDKTLSKNNNMSCASCHQKDNYFADALQKPLGGTRNSPSLYYAALQKGFFYDKRAGSLEGQMVDVVNNKNEFHLSLNELEKRVSSQKKYTQDFKKIYKKEVNNDLIRNAIASYIMTLSPFQSKFDLNMQGKLSNLTASEINGFNLFEGKAKCATCHFAPLFNGTVPVVYKESELELIGVPSSKDSLNAKIDADLGRYNVYKTVQRKYFFKTPTVRNIQKTAPYMHNGVYTSLEEVVNFYNKGGAAGLGIVLDYQTLPKNKLELTKKEQQDLIAFLKTLTDIY